MNGTQYKIKCIQLHLIALFHAQTALSHFCLIQQRTRAAAKPSSIIKLVVSGSKLNGLSLLEEHATRLALVCCCLLLLAG